MLMDVRPAREDDDERIAALVRRSCADVAARFALDRANCPSHPSFVTAEGIGRSRVRGTLFVIASEDGRDVGCAGLRFLDGGGHGLEKLAVLPDHRHRGVGGVLVAAIARMAAARGARRLEASIIADHVELESWYRRLGFRPSRLERFPQLPFAVRVLELGLNPEAVAAVTSERVAEDAAGRP
jgi:diamine N-acetyltransferase